MKPRYALGGVAAALTAAVLATAYHSPAAARGNAAAGEAKSTVCAACHGQDGNSVIPVNPSLAGQNYSYLAQTLKDYRDGKRANAVMAPLAAALSDEDIADLAAFYAAQAGKLVELETR